MLVSNEREWILVLFLVAILLLFILYKCTINKMKRKNNLYENIYKMENILEAYNEVCCKKKNKKKVRNYRENKCIYISRIYNILKNREYEVGE